MSPQDLEKIRSLVKLLTPASADVTSEYNPKEVKQVVVQSSFVTISIHADRYDDPTIGDPESWTTPTVSVETHLGAEALSFNKVALLVQMTCAAQTGLHRWVEIEAQEVIYG